MHSAMPLMLLRPYDDDTVNQTDVNAAVSTLESAVSTFEAAEIT